MRRAVLFTICFALIGILACGSISAKNTKKPDLYMHSFTCDSLGVEKSVFRPNERWYAGFVVRNDSNHPITYKVTHPMLLDVGFMYPDGGPNIPITEDSDQVYQTNLVLEPGAKISSIRLVGYEPSAKVGNYKAIMYYLFSFEDTSYSKLAHSQLRKYIPFSVKK